MKLLILSQSIALASGRAQRLMKIVMSVLLILVITQAATAQQSTATSNDDRELIKQLLNRIEELEARVKELEANQAKTVPPTPAPAVPAAEVPKESPKEVQDLAHAGQSNHHGLPTGLPGLQIRGFADVKFHASDLKGDTNSFALGQINLFITSRMSDKLSVLGEIVFEADENNAFGVDVERLLLQYALSDYLNLAFGRNHTSIGYYSTAYHHGTWFQTATGRPFIYAFEDEGGILPIHNVGMTASGLIPSGRLGLRYVAEIGNGRASRSPLDEAVQNVRDENNGKAVNFKLYARPEWTPGFETGFSVYRDRLTPEGLPKIGETIMAAYAVYQSLSLELLNEAIVIRHAPRGTGKVFNTPAFYTQVSRQFGKFRPYFRYQYLNVSDSEPVLSDVGRRNGPSFGLRYNFDEFAAFKIQYDRTERRRLKAINGLTLQLAFTF